MGSSGSGEGDTIVRVEVRRGPLIIDRANCEASPRSIVVICGSSSPGPQRDQGVSETGLTREGTVARITGHKYLPAGFLVGSGDSLTNLQIRSS
jgi:hypothetical protein